MRQSSSLYSVCVLTSALHASGLGVDVQGLVEVVYPDNVFVFGS